jgi:hypothetical protein
MNSFERRLATLERAAGGSSDELWIRSLTDEELDAAIDRCERLMPEHPAPNKFITPRRTNPNGLLIHRIILQPAGRPAQLGAIYCRGD